MKENIKRKFIPGDEWIYFKIYSGPKTLETILINELYLLVYDFFNKKIIDNFFFVRYADPDFHLRVRFRLTDTKNIKLIINSFHQKFKYHIDNELIWKILIDTYNRELERYGSSTINEIENLFNFNSLAVINFIKEIDNQDDDSIRLIWGMKFLDLFLNDFNLSLKDKENFCLEVFNSYSVEFNWNKFLKIQLDKKYRLKMRDIQHVIQNEDISKIVGLKYIDSYRNQSNIIVRKIQAQYIKLNIEHQLYKLMANLLHMHFNRLFRTNQRTYEFIAYYFFCKVYKSLQIREKRIIY